ncbi:DUF2202 domain-containing protein, partial [Lutimonas sp.]|uniref:DUF2202 domain-containing protein n=1 Tax=Lutimonas sp. TaxID=1872403 RepID=UPI003C7791CB
LTGSCSDETNNENELATLTLQEQEDLLFLREEEKLARDVYLYSFDLYGDVIFNQIASSEQQHMDQVLTLLIAYGLEDPASLERGVFQDQALQDLYSDLTTASEVSLSKALAVGATIEDLDINDLAFFESQTLKADLLNVYDQLKCGSKNHLRSYTDRLEMLGVDYDPQYLSIEEYNSIVSSDRERCGP